MGCRYDRVVERRRRCMPKHLSREERDGINEACCCLCLPCPLCSSLPHFSILRQHTLAAHTNAASETQIRFFLTTIPPLSYFPFHFPCLAWRDLSFQSVLICIFELAHGGPSLRVTGNRRQKSDSGDQAFSHLKSSSS